MIARVLRTCFGLLLIPLWAGYSFAFYEQLMLPRRVGQPEVALLLGITAYLALHVFLGAPSRAYVFGHELTHATAAWMSGGQVKGFKAGKTQGSVVTNKVTGFIALAPYMIPVYSILAALAYGIAGFFWDVRPTVSWFLFGLGASLAFHLVFTVEALKQKQTDLDVLGPILSVGLIYWANITCVLGVLSLVVTEVHFGAYLAGGWHAGLDLYRSIFTQIFR
ncbi:MAG: hypothetical protein Q7J69_04880 [Candidatus Omnitrophota bacterium]|nr:hypothetical protein [Candidatus Omnitrophota bacterium]